MRTDSAALNPSYEDLAKSTPERSGGAFYVERQAAWGGGGQQDLKRYRPCVRVSHPRSVSCNFLMAVKHCQPVYEQTAPEMPPPSLCADLLHDRSGWQAELRALPLDRRLLRARSRHQGQLARRSLAIHSPSETRPNAREAIRAKPGFGVRSPMCFVCQVHQ